VCVKQAKMRRFRRVVVEEEVGRSVSALRMTMNSDLAYCSQARLLSWAGVVNLVHEAELQNHAR
jgi:hypothetical protein